jgi:serine/threonine protein kinase
VVLKKLLPDVEGNDDAARRLLDEARIVAALSHENVVSIIEVGTEDDLPVMALEYVHGENAGTLRNKAAKRSLQVPIVVAARIVADAARGLHHAHEACDVEGRPLRIVHRDIAPKNLFVRTDGVTKVGDFGIAAAEQRLAKTATGAVTGTLSYMSPEQLASRPLTPASDQWSLGIVLWELLTGQRLFKADGPAEVIGLITEARLRSPRRIRLDCPKELSDIAKQMLQRDPQRRFPDLDVVANAIEGAIPECVGTTGRAAVAAFVEQMAGPELRERMRRIEEGAELTNFTSRPGNRVKPVSASSSASAGAAKSSPAETSSTGHAEGTSPGTRTVPERGLAQARQGGASPAPSSPPSRRWIPLAAVAVLVVVVAIVAAVVFAGGAVDPNTLTVRYLEDARPGRALVLREELLEDALEYKLDPARVDPVAVTLAGLCNERLDVLRTHHGHDEHVRAADRAAVAEKERLLQEKARTALSPLGNDYAVAALDMWAEECWAPIRWLEPTPAPDVQAAIKTRIVPQIEDTAAWREAVVRRLLRRAGVDVDVVMGKLWPIVKEREGLIAQYGSVPPSQMATVQARIKDAEARGHAALKGLAPDFENAVSQIAFIGFDDVDAPVPLFSYLPSVQAREPGAR